MAKKPYTKIAENSSDHLARIASRGASVYNHQEAFNALTRIGYYRLTGYMIPFQTGTAPDRHRFRPGTDFESIRRLYDFDKRLRWMILDAVEPIEVAVRCAINNKLALAHGPHWHTNPAVFYAADWSNLQKKIAEALEFDLATGARVSTAKNGSHLFLDHYYLEYSTPAMPPCWMLMEVLSFGGVAKIFSSLALSGDKKNISREFTFPDKKPIDHDILKKWLHSLSVLRNRCAHHSRVVHKKHPFPPVTTTNKRVGHLLTGDSRLREFLVLLFILTSSVNPKSDWLRRLYFLLDSTSGVDVSQAIGFRADWRNDPLWVFAW